MAREFSVVGKRLPQIHSKVKATGEAEYTVDITLPGMLHGKILRSPHPHARILNIDTSRAERLPGVKAVITGKDTPGLKYGSFRNPAFWDELTPAIEKVRYIGDAVAAVAAIDEDIAEDALSLIKVDYEPLPAVFDVEEAMKEGAPQIHDHVKLNTMALATLEMGDIARGFEESDYVREDRFVTQFQAHAFMEPHASLASYDSFGRLTLWTGTQKPHYHRLLLSRAVDMRRGDIRVIKPHVGGAFGGKGEVYYCDVCAAFLAKKAGKPVKIVQTREEEFVTRNRHSVTMYFKTGVKKDGTLVARDFRCILDGGAYLSFGPVVANNAGVYGGRPYRVPNMKYQGFRVYTNKPPCGALRGFGGVQSMFAFECQLDLIAQELGIDGVELRLKNATKVGDPYFPGFRKVSSCGLSECIQKVAKKSGWYEKRGKLPEGRGIGIACYAFSSGAYLGFYPAELPYSEVLVKVGDEGTAQLYTGVGDIGQGVDTVMAQIVAEELGMRLEDVEVLAGDTSTSGFDMGCFSSRGTMMAGGAALAAAADAKRQLFEVTARELGLKAGQELEARGGRVYVKDSPEKGITLAQAAVLCQKARGGMSVMGRGIFAHDSKMALNETPAWSFGVQAAEVEVDKETGQVKVLRITAAHDCGRAINPMSVEGQLEGSVHMGLGFGLSEEIEMENGKVLNPSFMDYKMFSALDMPDIDTELVETDEPAGPFGAKEAAEGLLLPTAPAVANAIWDAVGVRFNELPITAKKVVQALKAKSKK